MELTDILDVIAMPALTVDDDGIVTAMNAACRGAFEQAIRPGASLTKATAGLDPGATRGPDGDGALASLDGINVRVKVVRVPLHDDVVLNVMVLSGPAGARAPAPRPAPPPVFEALPSRGAPVDPLGGPERAAIAEEVASVLRHDLRNNLASVRNASFYLKRRSIGTALWESDPRVPQLFSLIEEMVARSTKLLEDRLSLKDLFERRVARVRGRDCVERAAVSARVEPTVTIEIDAGPGEIEADIAEVALAIRCLIENSAEATGSGGRVRVWARVEGLDYVVDVLDDGPGLGETSRDRVFRPFHTTRDGHAGLGLNIARRVARRYGGDVVIRPAATGACLAFSVRLTDTSDADEG